MVKEAQDIPPITAPERFHAKVLRNITNPPWFVTNKDVYRHLEVSSINDIIIQYNERRLKQLERRLKHTRINNLVINVLEKKSADKTTEINNATGFTFHTLRYRYYIM